MSISNLSEDAQVEINSLLGMEQPSTPEPEATAVEEEEGVVVETEGEPSDPVETDEVSDDEDDLETEDTQTSAPDIEYIKANGKKVKVDFNNREDIKRIYSLAAGAREWQVDRDNIQKKFDELSEKSKENSEVVEYLEGNKHDHNAIFQAVTGVSLEDKFKQWAEEQNMLGSMSEKEKAMYLSNQDHQKRIEEVQRREAELKKQLEAHETERQEAAKASQNSLVQPAYFKYNFDKELGNEQLELRLNRTLWNEAKSELSEFDNVTPDMVNETMERISNQIRQGFKISSAKSVKKAVATRKKVVKNAAQAAAVKPAKQDKTQELKDKIANGSFADILTGGYDLGSL